MIALNDLAALAMAGGQGGAAGGQGGGGGDMMSMVLMMVAIMGLMYFMTIRPQKKRERERQEMQKRIKAGDKVRTIGGIMGTVSAVSEKTITVCVCDKVTIEFVREAVNLAEEESKSEDKAEADKK